jgi:hypothetical protein
LDETPPRMGRTGILALAGACRNRRERRREGVDEALGGSGRRRRATEPGGLPLLSLHVTSSRGRSRSGGGEAGLRNRPQGGLNAAYALSVVIPLAGTAPLFVLLLAYLFPSAAEKISWRVVVGAVLIVLGVVLLSR